MNTLGKNIKAVRESRGMTQVDLAALLNVSQKTVSSWEIDRTEPKMGMVEQIAVALNCSKKDLIDTDVQLMKLAEDSIFIEQFSRLNPENQRTIRLMVYTLLADQEKTSKNTLPPCS